MRHLAGKKFFCRQSLSLGGRKNGEDQKNDVSGILQVLIEEHRQVFAAQDVIESMMKLVIKAARFFVTGCRYKGIVARSFAMRLMHLEFDAWADGVAPS